MAAVGSDAVDGAVMTLELPQSPQCVRVPELEHPTSAAAQQGRGAGDDAQRTHPVTVSIRDLLMDEIDINIISAVYFTNDAQNLTPENCGSTLIVEKPKNKVSARVFKGTMLAIMQQSMSQQGRRRLL